MVSSGVAVAFGAMFYAVSVMLTDEAAGAEFSTTTISIAYGGLTLVGGGLAYFIGRRADRLGAIIDDLLNLSRLEQQAAQREVQCSPAMFPVGALHDNGFIGDYALKASAFLDRFCHRPFLGLCSA